MCTLTYVPVGSQQFILTTNRDESLTRLPAIAPKILAISKKQVLCPIDGNAGGTWIATSNTGTTICLLNGGSVPHEHLPNYRMSRGKVVLDAFDYDTSADFLSHYNLEGIEPFTMILIERLPELGVKELVWDGNQKFIKTIDAHNPMLWASVTLYTPEIIAKRKIWFAAWLRNHTINQPTMINFHTEGGEGDANNDLVMRRGNIVATVSITSVVSDQNEITMVYQDLINGYVDQKSVKLQPF